MGFKRKRNIKIDNNTDYSVFMYDALNEEEIEDYEEVKSTGMEEEEEKEIHLQNIIKGTGMSIPLPVIIEIDNPCKRLYRDIPVEKRINWQRDCQNEYIEYLGDRLEFEKIVGASGVIEKGAIRIVNLEALERIGETEGEGHVAIGEVYNFFDAIYTFGEDQKFYNYVRNDQFIEFILNRCLIRYEKVGYEAYTCFRNRILYPKVKSRKNEQHITDKLERLYAEFHSLDGLCDLTKQRLLLEQSIYQKKIRMILKFGKEFDNSARKKLNMKRNLPVSNDVFYNRKKLKSHKAENFELFLDGDFFEKNFSHICKFGDESASDKNNDSTGITSEKEVKLFENRFVCEFD